MPTIDVDSKLYDDAGRKLGHAGDLVASSPSESASKPSRARVSSVSGLFGCHQPSVAKQPCWRNHIRAGDLKSLLEQIIAMYGAPANGAPARAPGAVTC